MNAPHYIFGPTLRQEIERLKAEAEIRTDKPPTEALNQSPLINTYVDQVHKWITSMTALQRQRAYTLQEIIALAGLKGRFRIRASNQLTGEALRICGLTSKREWSNKGRGKRYWQ